MVRCRVFVSGRVQGVWFRESCRREADANGVAGWIRNRADGRVEAVFEGEPAAVTRMIAWCREGPPRADVLDIETSEEAIEGLSGFAVR